MVSISPINQWQIAVDIFGTKHLEITVESVEVFVWIHSILINSVLLRGGSVRFSDFCQIPSKTFHNSRPKRGKEMKLGSDTNCN